MNIFIILKGILIGIAKIIPGLSGAVLMISFNLYDKAIDAITNFVSDVKNNFLFLFNLGLGVVIGIVFFSNILKYFINNYYAYTTSLFIGLILGGVPIIGKNINKNKSNYIFLFISFVLMLLLSISNINNSYIIKNNFLDILIFFISGILEAFGTVVPGISSTALLMIIGIYNIYIDILSNLYDVVYIFNNIGFIASFGIGLFFGIIIVSLLIDYLFKNYKSITFSIIMGISLSSLLLLFINTIFYVNSIYMFIICLFFIFVGYIISIKI